MDWTNLPTLETDHIQLRVMSDDDVEGLFAIFSNPEVMRYWSTAPLQDRSEAVTLLQEIREKFASRSYLKWAVALRSNDLMIGTVALFNISMEQRRAEIGYALGRSYWGKGYMHQALQRLLKYAFEELNFRRLEADVDPRNLNSIKSLERLGFQREGFLRERWLVYGEIQDALFYGLLRREWKP